MLMAKSEISWGKAMRRREFILASGDGGAAIRCPPHSGTYK
jgi:hypothetical protein